jgi:hypothetical protein
MNVHMLLLYVTISTPYLFSLGKLASELTIIVLSYFLLEDNKEDIG